MTLPELAKKLPNGFHDALLHRMELNLELSIVNLHMSIDIGSADICEPEYQNVELQLSGVKAFLCGDYQAFGSFSSGSQIVDGFIPTEKELPNLPQLDTAIKRTIYSFFLDDWNSFLHIAADEAKLIGNTSFV